MALEQTKKNSTRSSAERKEIPDSLKEFSLSLVYYSDLHHALSGFPVIDEDMILQGLDSEYDLPEEDLEGELPDEDLLEDYECPDDEIAYDEENVSDYFEQSQDESAIVGVRYLFAVNAEGETPTVELLESPCIYAEDQYLNYAILEHKKRRILVAQEIANVQRLFFKNGDTSSIVPTNQSRLCELLRIQYPKLNLSRLSRVLDAIWFRIPGEGDVHVPARYFFTDMGGYRSGLSKDQEYEYARAYISSNEYNPSLPLTKRARGLREYIERNYMGTSTLEEGKLPYKTERVKTLENLIKKIEAEKQ